MIKCYEVATSFLLEVSLRTITITRIIPAISAPIPRPEVAGASHMLGIGVEVAAGMTVLKYSKSHITAV